MEGCESIEPVRIGELENLGKQMFLWTDDRQGVGRGSFEYHSRP